MNKVAALPLAPSVQTLKRWRAEGKTNSRANMCAKLKPGRKGKLSEVEQKVIGGWVIHQLKKKRAVTGERVRQKVRDIFGVDVSLTWVSRTMKKLGLSSHATKLVKSDEPVHNEVSEICRFLQDIRAQIEGGLTLERVIAVDVTSFWNSGPVLRSYSLTGRYLPPIHSLYLLFLQYCSSYLFVQGKARCIRSQEEMEGHCVHCILC